MLAVTTLVAALAGASVAIGAKPAPTTTFKLKAALNVGQEKPIPKGTKVGASGRFTATLHGTSLTWRLTFTHLSGPATAAHIHAGARGHAGPIVVPLCGPCASPAAGGPTTLTTDEVKALLAGKYYVNVHTANHPSGEIRGQITKAPTQA